MSIGTNSKCPFTPGAHIVTYARDSGGDEQDRSVDQQNAAYQAFAVQHHLIIVKAFEDRAKPGSSTVGRVGFDAFIDYLRKSPAGDALAGALLWKINRFARNLQDSQFYKADLRRRGFTLHFLADNIPDAGDVTPIFEMLLEWKAQRDLQDISTDAKRGLASLVQMKKPDGSYEGFAPGTPPTCFTREQVQIGVKRNGAPRLVSRWIPDRAKWKAGQKAWAMRAAGSSLKKIHQATHLFNSEGSYVTFFANPIYTGTFHFGELTLENFVPALCTKEQWNAVQAQRKPFVKRGPAAHPRRVASRYLLSGLIYCGHCQAPMKGKRSGHWHCYLCSAKDRNPAACPSSRLSAEMVQATVINKMCNYILTPANLTALYQQWQQSRASSAETIKAELAQKHKDLGIVKRAIARLLNTVEKTDSPAAAKRLAQREKEQLQLETDIAQLQTRQTQQPKPLAPDAIAHIADRMRADLLSGDPEKVKPILQAFIVKVEAKKESGKVWYTFPLSSVSGSYKPIGSAPTEPLPIGLSVEWIKPNTPRPSKSDRNAAIIADRAAGKTLREISEHHGISKARIDEICAPFIPRRFPGRRSGR